MKNIFCFALLLSIVTTASSQDSIFLYPNGVPGSKQAAVKEQHVWDQNGILRINSVSRPSMTIYKPAREKNKVR